MPTQNANPAFQNNSGLKGRSAKDSFHELLRINQVDGLGDGMSQVTDGKGSVTPLQISATQVALNDMVWPTTGAEQGAVLRVSSTTNQLEWATEVPSGGSGSGNFDETAFWMGTV